MPLHMCNSVLCCSPNWRSAARAARSGSPRHRGDRHAHQAAHRQSARDSLLLACYFSELASTLPLAARSARMLRRTSVLNTLHSATNRLKPSMYNTYGAVAATRRRSQAASGDSSGAPGGSSERSADAASSPALSMEQLEPALVPFAQQIKGRTFLCTQCGERRGRRKRCRVAAHAGGPSLPTLTPPRHRRRAQASAAPAAATSGSASARWRASRRT